MSRMVKNGLIQESSFISFLQEDLDEDLDTVRSYERTDVAVQSARGVMDLYEKGYLTSEQYEGLLRYIVNKTNPIEVSDDGTVSNVYSSEYSEGEIAAWRALRAVVIKDMQEKSK